MGKVLAWGGERDRMEKAFRISSGQCACARAYVHVAIAEMWSEFQAHPSCIMEASAAFVVTILR